MSRVNSILFLFCLASLNACSSLPKSSVPIVEGSIGSKTVVTIPPEFIPEKTNDKGSEIYHIAEGFLGVPYRYGGSDPSGFDCSGLVQYAYKNAGISVPRTAAAQYKAAQSVTRSELKPGDVIFFRQHWRRISHVGIYAGHGRFIHAPGSGKKVTYSSLNEPYWQKHLVKTGRFY